MTDVRPIDRSHLVGDIAQLVPTDVALHRVLEGTSSGSTGAALRIPMHPGSVAGDVILLQHLLGEAGADWRPDPSRLALLNLVDQAAVFTYVSAMMGFSPAGRAPLMARVNLDAGAWRQAGDRERFLTRWDPQVLSTTPLPLLHLVAAGAGRSRAAPRGRGQRRGTPATGGQAPGGRDLGVPVIDLYGLRETGAVAARYDDGAHELLPRRVWVEVLDDVGQPQPDGVRGEITVTVAENPYGSLRRSSSRVEIVDLEGRAPVQFRAVDGSLRLAALAQPGSPEPADAAANAAAAIERLLGRPVELTVLDGPQALGPGKPRRFTTDAGV